LQTQSAPSNFDSSARRAARGARFELADRLIGEISGRHDDVIDALSLLEEPRHVRLLADIGGDRATAIARLKGVERALELARGAAGQDDARAPRETSPRDAEANARAAADDHYGLIF
jgi:hypothetical protein